MVAAESDEMTLPTVVNIPTQAETGLGGPPAQQAHAVEWSRHGYLIS